MWNFAIDFKHLHEIMTNFKFISVSLHETAGRWPWNLKSVESIAKFVPNRQTNKLIDKASLIALSSITFRESGVIVKHIEQTSFKGCSGV